MLGYRVVTLELGGSHCSFFGCAAPKHQGDIAHHDFIISPKNICHKWVVRTTASTGRSIMFIKLLKYTYIYIYYYTYLYIIHIYIYIFIITMSNIYI